jgi:hypothetical protein
MWLLLMSILIVIITIYIINYNIKENFADAPQQQSNNNAVGAGTYAMLDPYIKTKTDKTLEESKTFTNQSALKTLEESKTYTMEKMNLIVVPIVATVNTMVDSVNNTTQNMYNNCIQMSKKIGGKIKEYAETMKPFNRSADDCEGLRSVSINERHKLYIDDIRKNNTQLYNLLSRTSDILYAAPYDQQEEELQKFVVLLSQNQVQA